MPRSNFMNIAHRGASAYAPENTFAAFDKALSLGTQHAEFDVQFSADGHIVVIHDDTVDRTTDGSGPVASKTLAKLQSLDAGGWFSAQYAGQRIPTLGEMLERYKGRLHFHIEIKANAQGLSRRTADLVRGYGVADRASITSFHLTRLEELKGYAPELAFGWLVHEVNDSILGQAQEIGIKLLCPHSGWLTPDLVRNLHEKGFTVRAWGASDLELMRQAVDAGVDGLTVNFPDKLAEHLKAG